MITDALERARKAVHGHYGTSTTEINVGVLRELINALSGAKPAIQGEPVAWRYRHKSTMQWEYTDSSLVADQTRRYTVEPLYASQASPDGGEPEISYEIWIGDECCAMATSPQEASRYAAHYELSPEDGADKVEVFTVYSRKVSWDDGGAEAQQAAPQAEAKDCGICKGNPELCDPHDCGDAHATPLPAQVQPAEQVGPDRQAWLIEGQDHFPLHRWLRIVDAGKDAYLQWEYDANLATHFARREDAIAFQKLHLDFCALSIVTGHTFLNVTGKT